jgi:methyl-accepting chemotaxis protein
MKWFLNLRTPTKLWVGYGVAVLMTFTVGYFGFAGATSINKVQKLLATDALPGTAAAGDLGEALRSARIAVMLAATGNDAGDVAQGVNDYKSDADGIGQSLDAYEKTISQSEDRKLFEALKKAWSASDSLNRNVLALVAKEDKKAAETLLDGDSRKQFESELLPAIDGLMKFNVANGQQVSRQAQVAYDASIKQIVAVTLIAAIVCIFFAWFIGKLVSTMLFALNDRFNSLTTKCAADLKGAIEALERYDLTATLTPVTKPITLTSKDDLNQMAETFNTLLAMFVSAMDSFRNAQRSLADIVGKLGSSAATMSNTSSALTAATEQTGQASTEIADGSEKLARSASEAAATMEKLHDAVRQVKTGSEEQAEDVAGADVQLQGAAEVAAKVAESAQGVAAVAAEGRKKVGEIVRSNQEINAQVSLSSEKVQQLDAASQQIGTIVQSIEQIAEQTNLLALNAAIEAARAGEHGRGFAVVAEEVRKLAEQAGSATREIVTLIENVRNNVAETVASINSTVPLVEAGTSLTQEAGESLAEIAAAAEKVAVDAGGVAKTGASVAGAMGKVRDAAARNQELTEGMAVGAEQVSGAIQGVAAISQETAAGAEEMNATAEEVSASATELSGLAHELTQVVGKFKLRADGPVASELRKAA